MTRKHQTKIKIRKKINQAFLKNNGFDLAKGFLFQLIWFNFGTVPIRCFNNIPDHLRKVSHGLSILRGQCTSDLERLIWTNTPSTDGTVGILLDNIPSPAIGLVFVQMTSYIENPLFQMNLSGKKRHKNSLRISFLQKNLCRKKQMRL